MKTFVFTIFLSLILGNAHSTVCDYSPIISTVKSNLDLIITTSLPQKSDSKDGSITININGGTPPYTTHISGTDFPAETFGKNNFTLTKIGVGSFTILVQDQNKTVVHKTIDITVQ
jgi:hypothetical protein